MNTYKIRILNKVNIFDDEDITVFIDGIEIKNRKSNFRHWASNGRYIFSHIASEGIHTLRIEQVRLYKVRRSYLLIPLYILDLSLLDKSPFYAVYETQLYLDRDIDVFVTLNRAHLKPKRFIKIINYKFSVVYSSEVESHLLKNDFLASDKERRHWLITNTIFITLPLFLLIFLFNILTIQSIKQYTDIWGTAFFAIMTITFILVLIYLLRNCYANYKNTNNK